MQHKLSSGKLLDESGNLAEAGYATTLARDYSRADIRAPRRRIKEWDYYYFADDRFGVALTVDDNSYMTMVSVSVIDFERASTVTASDIKLLTRKRIALPGKSFGGDIEYASKRSCFRLNREEDGWRLRAEMRRFDGKKDFACDYRIEDPAGDSMVIATPFDKPGHFYYNQKINCLSADGSFSVGGDRYAHSAIGVLDWGRGVWTYKNTWYWASLSCEVEGVPVGFNLGYGFGDTSAATENMLFYDGKAHKLGNVRFEIPKEGRRYDYTAPWRMADEDGRLELTFTPIVDRFADTNALFVRSCQHQVFGRFEGRMALDDGASVKLDGPIGFAERVYNRW